MKFIIESTQFDILENLGIENYTFNSDGLIDVDGTVDISGRNLTKIPIKFGRVSGNFYCYHNQLVSLEGAPKEVGGDFLCNNNQLTSLQGPREVSGSFYCHNNQLTTLQGAPREVSGDFWCDNNPLPRLIQDYEDKKFIIKNQDDYSIWRRDGSLDEYRFKDMIKDI